MFGFTISIMVIAMWKFDDWIEKSDSLNEVR